MKNQNSKNINRLIENTVRAEVIKEMKKNQPKRKPAIKLTENDLLQIVSRVISEEKEHPAQKITKKNHAASGKVNNASTSATDKKMKDAANFKGNDKANFPTQNKGKRKADHVNDKQKEHQDDFRGGGMEDLKYRQEPSKQFKDRVKAGLRGEGGFPKPEEGTNSIKSDVGDNLEKKAKRKAEKIANQPMYNKDVQPTGSKKEDKEPKGGNALNESLDKELERMTFMYLYSDKKH
jgi:hypothetical protein